MENVMDIYHKTTSSKSTQLIFCDSSTPKKGFNIYDEVRDLLLAAGVPLEEIAYIHDANTEKRRQTLYKKVCNGQVRILLGSTFKLGLGVPWMRMKNCPSARPCKNFPGIFRFSLDF